MKLSRANRISTKGRAVFALVIQTAVCAVALLFQFVGTSALPGTYTISLALALLLGWCIGSWKLSGRQLFDPYCIFLTAAFLFNAGHGLLEVIGTNDTGILSGAFSDEIVRQTLVLSFAGLAGLHLGALFVVSVGSGRVGELCWATPDREVWVRRIGWVLLLIASPAAAIWLVESIAIVSVAGYTSLYDRDFQSGIAAAPLVLSGFLVPGALFLTASGRQHALDSRLAASVIVIFAVLQFYIGYRSTAAMPLIAWMWLRHKLIKPIRWSVNSLLVRSCSSSWCSRWCARRATCRSTAVDRVVCGRHLPVVENPAISSIHEMGSVDGNDGAYADAGSELSAVRQRRRVRVRASHLLPESVLGHSPDDRTGHSRSDWLVRSINPMDRGARRRVWIFVYRRSVLNFGTPGVIPVMAIYGILLVCARHLG